MSQSSRKDSSRSRKHHSIVNEQELINEIEKKASVRVETDTNTINGYNAQLYMAVIRKIGKEVPINIWGTGEGKIQKRDCSCGELIHSIMYWRTLDDSMTGHLLLCHCNTAYAKCFVDPYPVIPDFSNLTIPEGDYAGIVMLVVDGKVVDLEELRKRESRLSVH